MPLLWLSIAFGCGILFASYFPGFQYGYLTTCCIALAAGCIEIWGKKKNTGEEPSTRRITPVPYGFLIAATMLGSYRYCISLPEWTESDLAWYNDQKTSVRFTGNIMAPPEEMDGVIKLQVKALQITSPEISASEEGTEIKGNALVFIRTADIWQYGDIVELEGKPVTAGTNEDFSYKEYLAQRGIHSLMYYPHIRLVERKTVNPIIQAIYRLRRTFHQNIMDMLPQSEASLLSGILLGIESDIPERIQDDFRNTGTTHIIAISGFNIAILAAMFTVLFNYLLRNVWKSLLATSILITMYTIMVGSDPSVVRAAIMGIMGLFGRLIGRKQSGVNSLFFAGASMCLFNPRLLWDVSFQLSFAATFGLIVFADPLLDLFIRVVTRFTSEENARKLSGPAGEYFFFTIAAQITTLPVMAAHFHQISLNSLLANIIILPAQPAIMVMGGISAILSLFSLHIGQAAACLVWIPLTYTIHAVEWIAHNLPAKFILDDINFVEICSYYFIIITIRLFWKQISQFLQPGFLIGSTVSAGAIALITWQHIMDRPDRLLHLDLIRDEQGDSSFLLTEPSGRSVLINQLDSNRQMFHFLDTRVPVFSRQIDILVAVDSSQHMNEELSYLLSRYAIRSVLVHENLIDEEDRKQLQSASQQDFEVKNIRDGQSIDLGEDASMWILTDTGAGTAVYIEWKNLTLLIPESITPEDVRHNRYRKINDINVLILSQAAEKSITQQDLSDYRPDILITPSKCPDMLPENNFRCIDLVTHGWISLTSDGDRYWLTSEKGIQSD